MPGLSDVVPFERRLHDRSEFSCGESSLDDWLKRVAGQAQSKDTARTYVICEAETQKVIGYFSLCAFSIQSQVAPKAITQGPLAVPAILLGRLAVDGGHQGSGLGEVLLTAALLVSVRASVSIGARVMVVHALHSKAASFYLKHAFRAFDAEPLTLYLPMQDIRKSLNAAGLQ